VHVYGLDELDGLEHLLPVPSDDATLLYFEDFVGHFLLHLFVMEEGATVWKL
jgi:hypothetical protein